MTLDDYQALKRKVDKLTAAASRAEGELAGVMRRIEEAHGVTTVEGAESVLAALKAKERKADKKYQTARAEFEAEHKEALDGLG